MSAVIVGQMYDQGVKMSVFGAGVGTLGAVIVGNSSKGAWVRRVQGHPVRPRGRGAARRKLCAGVRWHHLLAAGYTLVHGFLAAVRDLDVNELSSASSGWTWAPTPTQPWVSSAHCRT